MVASALGLRCLHLTPLSVCSHPLQFGDTALAHAVKYDMGVELLLEHKADVNGAGVRHGGGCKELALWIVC